MRSVEHEVQTWPLARPFVISRGTSTSVKVIRVRIGENGFYGVGECTPTVRYHHTADSVITDLTEVSADICRGLTHADLQTRLPPGPARNALDCAFWDLESNRTARDLWTLTGVLPLDPIVTAYTVGIASPEVMAASARDALARGARLLKVKLNNTDPIERVQAVREAAPHTRVIVDANEAWTPVNLAHRCHALARFNVEMVEQPLPADNDAALADFNHPLIICADESCHTRDDIPALRQRYDMVNIKLDKSGGLTEALAMVDEARRQGLAVMVGCMLGTSLAMRAALPAAAQAAIVDLDGPLWLKQDVEQGLVYRDGIILAQ